MNTQQYNRSCKIRVSNKNKATQEHKTSEGSKL